MAQPRKVSRGERTLKWNRRLGTEHGNWKTMGTAAAAALAAAAWIACVGVRESNVFAFTIRPLDSNTFAFLQNSTIMEHIFVFGRHMLSIKSYGRMEGV